MGRSIIRLGPLPGDRSCCFWPAVAHSVRTGRLGLVPSSVLRDTVAVTAVDPHGTRVVVADDDVLLGEGLASLLERGGYEVVGRAGDGSELIRLARESRPHLAVI